VGIFRPARKVTDENGRDWEIYVSRTELPRWRTPKEATLHQIVVPLVRYLVGLPALFLRGRRSGVRSVAAITFWPVKETYTWSTTGDHVQRVVDQIAEGLEHGDLARPLGATFRGGP
jgi:hypothetical protein